jgi:Protein of unknown function (DUF2844)
MEDSSGTLPNTHPDLCRRDRGLKSATGGRTTLALVRRGPLPRAVNTRSISELQHRRAEFRSGRNMGMSCHQRARMLLQVLAAGVALAGSSATLAALGADAGSVAADRVALAAQLRVTATLQYDLHEISSGAQTVHEYVSRQGQVFAVTWQGPVPPNMRQLLGEYFGRFQSAAVAAHQQSPGQHRQFQLAQPDLVILSSGRLRNFRGIAYLPTLLPAGVTVDQLQ